MIINKKIIDKFRENGFLEIKSNKIKNEILQIRKEIKKISIYLLKKDSKIKINEKISLESLLYKIASKERKKLSKIYDICKTIEGFHKLCANDKILKVAKYLLKTDTIFFQKDFSGIRLDSKLTESQSTLIHQEIHSFPFSINGLVVWIPISKVNKKNGSIILWPKTHKKIRKFSGNENKFVKNFKEKKFQLANKSGKINVNSSLLKNPLIVNSKIGSVYLLDVRLIHGSYKSSKNNKLMRITFQNRIFDFKDPFFQWKLKKYHVNHGLKNPFTAQKLFTKYNNEL